MRRHTRHMSWERVVVGRDVGDDTAGWLADGCMSAQPLPGN
jgi:hypothetical protein